MSIIEKQILTSDDIRSAIERIALEIAERNGGVHDIVLVGICHSGVFLAERLAAALADSEGEKVPVGCLDVTLYRDDLSRCGALPLMYRTSVPFGIEQQTVVLVDDIIATGRMVRSALDALFDLGRPESIQLAVLIDCGHRELPIRADFVGKHVLIAQDECVEVRLNGSASEQDEVVILHPATDSV